MRVALVINPAAGNGRGAKAGVRAATALRNRGVEYVPHISQYPGHAVQLARKLNVAELDAIVCVGGDGTLFEVVNGLMQAEAPTSTTLGVIPVGSGNSFSQDLGVFGDFDGAVGAILNGERKAVDVAWVSTERKRYYFMNMLGFGFVSDVCHAAIRYKALRHLSYVIGVFQITAALSHCHLVLTVDGATYERTNCFVEVCNSRYTAGTMLMAPQAVLDDGYLDLVILNRISRGKLLKSFPLIFRGAHLELPEVETFRARHIVAVTDKPKILTPDGELLGSTPIEVGIIPRRLQVLGKWDK
ncbi:MAG: diacylglycerol kinase family lipid kinase [candidate division KSB1 bacterium]|nr:diacylglycerol kinase family lipid kinase [candidate division KSB1 bacterium]MDZ7394079.1 diacylglycerol kinase family lipid kinase [candidate division KSB1 bacterium]MDZ7411919.1 diacylglycerol kinase family lipid kinase [candidate division KSB1 bacterium]